MLFLELAELAEKLAGESGRLKKRAALADTIRRTAAESAAQAGRFCLYLAGQPFAEADARKLNAGGAILTRALKDISGASDAALAAAYRRHGDLGAAAFDLLHEREQRAENREHSLLTLGDVAEAFDTMARARTTAARFAAVEGLLRRTSPLEAKYLLKLMLGDMRIGVKQSLIEEAIGLAANVEVAAVRHAVMLEADLCRVVERAFHGTLGEARMRLFHPLGFMLASPVETPDEAMKRFSAKPKEKVDAPRRKPSRRKKTAEAAEDAEQFPELPEDEAALSADAGEDALATDVEIESGAGTHETVIAAFIEDKYDGIRAQIHCGDAEHPGQVAIYSRNREDITESFPELEEAFGKLRERTDLNGLIFDGEILGWDLAAEKALPFSTLGQRIGRKRVDDAIRRAIPVVFMAFDLLFADGELLLPLPLHARRQRLEKMVERVEGTVVSPVVEEKIQAGLFEGLEGDGTPGVSASRESVRRLRLSPVRRVESAEGIDRAYSEARERANEGVMIKAAGSPYLPGRRGLAWIKLKRELATLDVVITGAEFGHGKRAGLLSDYTFAVRGVSECGSPELMNVGKAYSGVTDAEIAELTEWLKAHTVEDFGHFRTVEPLRVLEVAFNNIMRSDRHASGFALRFPRILRVRDDKPVGEIDTLARVMELYESQPDKGE